MYRIILLMFFSFLFWSCTSCNENNPENDYVADIDNAGLLDDLSDENITEADVTSDKDIEIPDIDKDNNVDEVPDVDENVLCLDLRYNENTLKTNFPFKDKDGRSTFCRPGCDTPTETDPQCVRNIWEWDNWEAYQEYLSAEKKDPEQEWERECYPWPCKLPDMVASNRGQYGDHKCDSALTVNGYQSSMGAVWTHGMSEGVAGMNFNSRAIEYNPEKDEFISVGKTAGMLSFSQNRYVLSIFDSKPSDNPDYSSYVVSVQRKNNKFYYELIYDTEIHKAFMSNPSFAGEKWVLIQIRPGKQSSVTDVKYAKAGDWEWHSLGLGKVYEGNIVGDHLTFMVPGTDPDRQIYYCDLSKYPKSYQDCYKVTDKLESGEAELGHSPRIDEENENRLIYSVYNSSDGRINEVLFKDGVPSETKEYVIGMSRQPTKVKGNLMSFTSSLQPESYLAGCWYRFDKQKVYCPNKSDWTTEEMFYSIFDGKWQIWKENTLTLMRDWDCYCKEEGICPFEE